MSARTVRQTTDHAALRRILTVDPLAGAYMLGDLDPRYADFCDWYVSADADGHDDAIITVYNGLSAPALLTMGSVDGITALLERFIDVLPEHAHAHLAEGHRAPFLDRYTMDRELPMARMGVRAAELAFDAAWEQRADPVISLGHRDTGDIMALSAHYPDSFFEPSQLSTGYYVGIRVAGELVSMAGVHIVSATDRLAVLGNVVTHPEHRGHGLSTACTGILCRRLAESGHDLIALNVERHNRSAIRVYEKLGFRRHLIFTQGFIGRGLEQRVR
ncbi:MAG: GNAT family N-acetyltransferase [Deltaproteobacteria bacterium]|nr:MAG: GNAT family N-acetyltransferase [Deltaproteobacteria bacterium]